MIELRLDKFLKVSRLIKRRTMAKEVADQGRVTINGNKAKSSSTVTSGDELVIKFGQKLVTIEVNDLRENVKKFEAESLYKVIKEEQNE
ncbi:ribosomal 50S subunit-recycling heat shock protein [Virgibacillus natechei]|uniref:RQC P-site tRNA stabilizing factor n=1 Tax=Virgibacillus natechei TaxID=1216297 RepID=A0ABS4IHF0_9BACI|nr:ribosomal 50S subunit-recycling heat shock protein [Virgibacillus natechei]